MSDIDTLISKLESLINSLRTVKVGDYVLSDDHNLLVDALKTAYDIVCELESYANDIASKVSYVEAKCNNALFVGDSVIINDAITMPSKGLQDNVAISDQVSWSQS